MGAMPEEVSALLPPVQGARVMERAGRKFVHGTVHGRTVVVVFSRWGKVAAASTATELIVGHGVERIVFSGVAGSLREDVHVGDVVVASTLYQHDLDASPFFPPLEVPLLGLKGISADAGMRVTLGHAARAFVKEDAERVWREVAGRAAVRMPRVHEGDVASGDQVIATAAARMAVAGRVPTGLCVEMEGAAVAQVCFEHGVPFACVRTISDSADEGVEESVGPFLGGVAGAYTAGIVGRWLRDAG
jgi:adenosylhomocysteine nucleosidase